MGRSNGIYSILKGSFLTSRTSSKNWKVIITVIVLLLVMVGSGHSADAKVVLIAKLNRRKRELRAEYTDTKTSLARMKLESSVRRNIKGKGISVGDTSPQKIKVIVKE